MNNYFEFIKLVAEKPGMFKVSRVEDIYFITLGYTEGFKGNSNSGFDSFQNEFSEFVSRRYDPPRCWCFHQQQRIEMIK